VRKMGKERGGEERDGEKERDRERERERERAAIRSGSRTLLPSCHVWARRM
jgi:hypothetical protein